MAALVYFTIEDWRSVLVITLGVIALLASSRWWLPPLLSALQGKQIKATWADKSYGLTVDELKSVPTQPSLLSSQISSVSYRVAVVNESRSVSDQEVKVVISALQTQVHRDFAPAWGTDADLAFLPRGTQMPADSWALVLLDDSDYPGALGYRDLTKDGLPMGKVFVGDHLKYNAPWTLTASHQLLEMLANPRLNLTVLVRADEKTGSLYIYEVCNPCEAEQFGYKIDGTLVSDFVFPSWFEENREPGSTKFDYCDHMTGPFELLPGGNATVQDVGVVGWRPILGPAKLLPGSTRASARK